MSLKKRILNNHILAICIGLVYFWFGILKFFPGLSPAESLAKDTITILTFNLIPPEISILLLALWETLVGLMLILNVYRRPTLYFMLVHVAFTFTPLFFFTNQSFTTPPYAFTLLGQYIFKNIIIIGAFWTLHKQLKPPSLKNIF
ncbi:DoxX family membrane protein [Winogradskyella sp.]|uniref:DoxX family membrane protein n=1 Tax=Winogradskyella sp. TaxID=1883156 RepID=UPI003517551A